MQNLRKVSIDGSICSCWDATAAAVRRQITALEIGAKAVFSRFKNLGIGWILFITLFIQKKHVTAQNSPQGITTG